MARHARLEDLPRLANGDFEWRPVRRELDVTAFGVNGYTAPRAGTEIIEDHDELSPGAGGHEELYLIMTGHVRFQVGDDEIDARQGDLILVPKGVRRRAVATADQTTVLVVGGVPGAGMPPSPFEYWYAAEPAYAAGNFEEAITVATEGLEHHPDHPHLNYQLACYHALAGNTQQAIDHLTIAARDHRIRDWASDDSDLDSIRSHPAWPFR
jgi:hypothetical protein